MSYTWLEFNNEVKKRLSDSEISDDTAVRALADFTKAKAARDLLGDTARHDSFWGGYLKQRSDLLGWAVTLTDAELQQRVRALITDTTVDEPAAIRAVADYVKSRIASEVDKDQPQYDLYNTRWMQQKARLLGYVMTSDDATLRTEVGKLITVDDDRQGIQEAIPVWIAQAKADVGGLSTWLDGYIDQAKRDLAGSADRISKWIRAGVIELQEHIDFYRIGHEKTYQLADVTDDGEAVTGKLPEEAQTLDSYYVALSDTALRVPVYPYPWDSRFDLVVGNPRFGRFGDGFLLAFEPHLDATAQHGFTLFPPLMDGYKFSLFWTGLKLDFVDTDITPFDESFVEATAFYVQWKRKGDPAYKEDYLTKRRALWRIAQTRMGIRKNAASPQPLAGGAVYQPVTA